MALIISQFSFHKCNTMSSAQGGDIRNPPPTSSHDNKEDGLISAKNTHPGKCYNDCSPATMIV